MSCMFLCSLYLTLFYWPCFIYVTNVTTRWLSTQSNLDLRCQTAVVHLSRYLLHSLYYPLVSLPWWIQVVNIRLWIKIQVRSYSLKREWKKFLFWNESEITRSPQVTHVRQGLYFMFSYLAFYCWFSLLFGFVQIRDRRYGRTHVAIYGPAWAQDGWEQYVQVWRFLTDAAILWILLWPFCYLFNPVLISRKLDVGSQEIGGREWLAFLILPLNPTSN